jgi:excisionase family DNA binding protein
VNATNESAPILFSVLEAARSCGIGRTKLLELVAAGEIRTIRIGKRRLVPRAELERYVASRTATGT